MRPHSLLRSLPGVAILAAGLASAAPALGSKAEKIEALVSLHDLKTAVAIGDYYLKQRTLFAVRDRLAAIGREQELGPQWNPSNPYWKQAEQALYAAAVKQVIRDFSDLEWLSLEWAQLDDRDFSEPDIDQLLAHFNTGYGRKQLMIVDHGVAIHVQGALAFSGKLVYDVPGLEADRSRMQHLYSDEDDEMRFNIHDSPEGQRFALSPVGKRYFVNAVLNVSGMISRRLDQTAGSVAQTVKGLSDKAQPAVDAFRRGSQG